ncbi:TonB family protein [Hymenobacter perfusus]|uniref:TonB family protein n=1 Tax=Hymenobacter perfusus TaxID=1236770 RepID=A0A428K8G0_9BACT|nr:TonB family protein [Hymenobacter perfusus]RSK42754.1 TonB family protein [Hymenobacter perfusus]
MSFSFIRSAWPRVLLVACLAGAVVPVAQAQKSGKKSAAAPIAAPPRIYSLYEVQTRPEYAEGEYALRQYLQNQLRRPAAVKAGTERGVVTVSFVVQPDGRLTDAFVARGLSAASNAEALRLVQAMPRWRPARYQDKAVPVQYPISIPFEPPMQKAVTVRGAPDLSGLESDRRVVEEVGENKVYTYVEQMPVFPGGQSGLINYIQASLRYPAEAAQKQVEGKVFVKFTVEPSGKAINPEIIKGLGAGCDEEVLRVIRVLPPFEPGKQNGRTVSVSYTVPVTFSLQTTPGAPGVTIPPAPTLPKPEEKVYTYVEQMPRLAGTTEATIASALQAGLVLPKEIAQGTTEGRVFVSFVVGLEGKAEDAKVVRSLCPACDAAALAAVASLPRLEPGRQNGNIVRVQLTQVLQLYSPTHVFEPREAATQATFPGGGVALRQYFTEKLKEPKVLAKENLRGAVEVRFVVQADGRIGAGEVVRPLCRSCDEEALRLVRAMPVWAPARDATGQPIAVRQSVIIPMPAPELPRKNAGAIED